MPAATLMYFAMALPASSSPSNIFVVFFSSSIIAFTALGSAPFAAASFILVSFSIWLSNLSNTLEKSPMPS